ncbi:hypothetical protein AVEN_247190-1 [Araneus ventricosus]|uniref:Uncharacterized protein n=1 Tax=Araneus ventricosus TaxID=182803 RepID=A0A4Y2MDG6_ARAVE|nr:hypothetical protein AVEN_247190-1 [Araneus ventricosus]
MDLSRTRPAYVTVLRWNRVSSLELNGPKLKYYHWATAAPSSTRSRAWRSRCGKGQGELRRAVPLAFLVLQPGRAVEVLGAIGRK